MDDNEQLNVVDEGEIPYDKGTILLKEIVPLQVKPLRMTKTKICVMTYDI